MKKIILLMLFISCSAVMVAQEQPTTKVSDEINAVVDNVFDNTTEAIKQLSDALKVPAEHVYSVLVKQQVVRAWATIICLAVSLILFFIFYFVGWKDDWDNVLYVFGTIIFAIVFFAALIAFLDFGLAGLINPEYGAIKEIMSLL